MFKQESIDIQTNGRGFTEITTQVNQVVQTHDLQSGLCHVFNHHTSSSLIISENADPSVRTDLETFMQDLVEDGNKKFTHTLEGPDDMSAHIRTILTTSELSVPIINGELGLGTWQGIYLWEHRYNGHQRKITISLMA